jgi:hypothetical protein
MNTNIVLEQSRVSSIIKYLPAVSIFLPVHAETSSKSQLEHTLKSILEKIEPALAPLCPEENAASIIRSLKTLIDNLNYNTRKKSIAIFVSPVIEKIYYLEGDVEESVDIDEFFETGGQVFKKTKCISLPRIKSISNMRYHLLEVN